ncbi:MAG: DUF1080 domain-containing protein [Planctomycetes bacterium]|nr:DUF1080 domain-containing protein [Planctomycetota bacterium]
MLTLLLLAASTSDLTERFDSPRHARVTLWASSPALYNPTAIDIDARGRVWVAEAVNYRKWNGRNPGFADAAGDRIVILADTDNDGVADSSKVFAQSVDLVAPLGIAVLGSRVIVSCSPTAWVFHDDDGDDIADRHEPLLAGFGGFDHDHGLHSFVGGPDGAWWFNVGNAGPHRVQDALGRWLRSGSIYNDGGPALVDNRPALASDDGRVWTGGLALRVQPDGSRLEVRAHNFRNNYELALDSFGNIFQTDNDDGPPASRTLWCLEGGDHGFFSPDGSRLWSADQRPGQDTLSAHWHADDPGVAPSGCVHGHGGPTGLVVYEGSQLRQFEGWILDADAGAGAVYAHKPVQRGAGIALEHGLFLRPKEGDSDAQHFRPSDVAVGLDGSVYVADWFDPLVGGHAMADTQGYGRILRVASQSSRNINPRMSFERVESCLAALLNPAVNVRWQAFEALDALGAAAQSRLEQVATAPQPRLAARALWLLARRGDSGRGVVREYLGHPNADLRVTAFRALRAVGADITEIAKFVVKDDSLALKRELAIALRDVDAARAVPLLAALCEPWPANDRAFVEAIGIGAQGREEALYAAIAARDSEREDGQLSERRSALAWRLHPDSALEDLRREALESRSAERRARALDGLAFSKSREAADAMLQLALAGPLDLRPMAAWWVRQRDSNDWRGFGLARELGDFHRDAARKAWSSGVLRESRLVEIDVDLVGARHVLLAVTPAGDGISYDWADWIGARFLGPSGEISLASLPWVRASSGFGSTYMGKSCEGGPLVVDGTTYTDGFGTHAASEIVFRIPDGMQRLVARCSPDDNGPRRAGSTTSVEFEVWLDSAPDSSGLAKARGVVLDASASTADRLAAALELLATPQGAQVLLHLAATARLSEELVAALRGPLVSHADPAVRALAAAQWPAATTNAPSRTEVLALEGDRRRGALVFFGERAACSRCHALRGRGADVGPELSGIGSKYSREQLLEELLAPSRALALGYQTWTIETRDGLVHTGFLQAGSPLAPGTGVVVLKDTDGHRVALEESEIESSRRHETSVMPDGVLLALTAQDQADLLAFLRHDPSRPRTSGARRKLFNGVDLDGWEHYLSAPTRREDVWSVRDGVLRCEGSPFGYLQTRETFTDFVLELEWRWAPDGTPGNSGVLLRKTGPDQIWPRSLEAQLMHRNAGDFWIIGGFPVATDMARTSGDHCVRLAPTNERPVGEWNRYHITAREGEVTLEVNGELQNRAQWADEVAGTICLQSEGGVIEFREVALTPLE